MANLWTEVTVGRAWNTQPLDQHGDPAWFHPEHFTWLERALRLDQGEALGRIWTSGSELVDRAEVLVGSCNPERVRFDLDEPINRFGQPAWFTPEHNAWLEETYGWEDCSILESLWQEDGELIDKVEELFYHIATSSDEALELERQYVRAELEQAKQHLAQNNGDIARVQQALGALVAQLGGVEEVYAYIERYKERLDALQSLGSPGRTYQLAVNAGLASPTRHPDHLEGVQRAGPLRRSSVPSRSPGQAGPSRSPRRAITSSQSHLRVVGNAGRAARAARIERHFARVGPARRARSQMRAARNYARR